MTETKDEIKKPSIDDVWGDCDNVSQNVSRNVVLPTDKLISDDPLADACLIYEATKKVEPTVDKKPTTDKKPPIVPPKQKPTKKTNKQKSRPAINMSDDYFDDYDYDD